MARVTISLPDELDRQIREQLEYGDNYSEIVTDALVEHLKADE